VNPSNLMAEAIAVALLAPAASLVAASRRERGPWAALWPVLLAVATFVAVSAAAAFASRTTTSSGEWRAIAVTHVTLAAAALAFAAMGALCGRLFADALDAAAASGTIALTVTFALLLAGDVAAQLPSEVLDAGLLASPLVAVASAANIDVLRDDTWYRLSPIAHRFFNYPTWYQAAASHAVVSLACIGGFVWKRERIA
jgi:hypothetical protein